MQVHQPRAGVRCDRDLHQRVLAAPVHGADRDGKRGDCRAGACGDVRDPGRAAQHVSSLSACCLLLAPCCLLLAACCLNTCAVTPSYHLHLAPHMFCSRTPLLFLAQGDGCDFHHELRPRRRLLRAHCSSLHDAQWHATPAGRQRAHRDGELCLQWCDLDRTAFLSVLWWS